MRAARFDGAGIRLVGSPPSSSSPPLAPPFNSAEAASPSPGTVVFEGGAASLGPVMLPSDGAFELQAVLPHSESDQTASVRVQYEGGVRSGFELSWNGEEGGDVEGPVLESRDIAGAYVGRSVRWAPGGISVKEDLTREYGAVNSRSDMLVRLPLGVSVVAPRIWGGSRMSFGCGWTPVEGRRPVMVRSYEDDGRLGKVDWRVEKRLE